MARQHRIDLPGLPRHIRVRGVDGMSCFRCDKDRHVFLGYLDDALADGDCCLHAFVLMTNHVHLLATGNREGAVATMMHSIGLRYARYFNTAHDRTGTLFEGRYRASPVEDERYFLACMRYIELNPVRAGLVNDPADYPWSSFRHNAGLAISRHVTFHEEFLRLGATPRDREAAWTSFVAQGMGPDELDRIRRELVRNRPLGNPYLGSGSRTRPQV
jgi:putative transposase